MHLQQSPHVLIVSMCSSLRTSVSIIEKSLGNVYSIFADSSLRCIRRVNPAEFHHVNVPVDIRTLLVSECFSYVFAIANTHQEGSFQICSYYTSSTHVRQVIAVFAQPPVFSRAVWHLLTRGIFSRAASSREYRVASSFTLLYQ